MPRGSFSARPYGMESDLTRARAKRKTVIYQDVQTRLRRICAEMPTPLFDEMVERIAGI